MIKQKTLKKSFSLEGKGLHTGLNIRITFNPAPENHGYKIKRIDIPGHPVINALAENVVQTQRGTILEANGAKVSTVEHALAALYASGIDNCLIEVNAPEFPILDGSSIIYIDKIKEAGIKSQKAEREFIQFRHKRIRVIDEVSGSSLLLLPSDTFSIQVNISFDSKILAQQYASLTDIKDFPNEIASARTFVFVKEIMFLFQNNLIKGGDLDNAIVIYDTHIPQPEYDRLADTMGVEHKNADHLGYITNRSLLFPNEPARHKLLDVIGDLALAGGFVKGKVIATCPGHKINTMFARAIRDQFLSVKKKKENSKNKEGLLGGSDLEARDRYLQQQAL